MLLRSRPISRVRYPIRVVRHRRRWGAVSWWYSLLLVVPLLLIGADRFLGLSPVDDDDAKTIAAITFKITDATGGQPIAGAEVRAGDRATLSNDQGEAFLQLGNQPVTVTVTRDGYQPVSSRADGKLDRIQHVSLQPAAADQNGEPPEHDAGGATTGDPTVTSGPQPTAEVAANPAETPGEAAAAAPGEITGTVTNEAGEAIRSALVRAGEVRAKTRRDGTFRLKGAPDQGELIVSASGYADQRVQFAAATPVNVALVRQQINAVFLAGVNAGDEEVVDSLIRLADETEVNAIVIDIKEYYVWYDTGVEFFRDADAVRPTYDPRELLARMKEHGIYTIARSVVFNDPLIAENRPELAVRTEAGDIWRGWDDAAWVNPFNKALWQPNIDLALEAAALGFDEIQYDYIRFPSDGDLTIADFGPNYTEEGRVAAIVDFLKLSKKQLEPTGVKLAVDVFGIVAIQGDDQGIGQRIADIAPIVDYICPMIYPSHFNANSIDVGGEPNDFPYETIQISLALAKAKMPGMELKLRPWLQDFNLGREYTAEDVRAQIQATEDEGVSGWLLWNAANVYTGEALGAD